MAGFGLMPFRREKVPVALDWADRILNDFMPSGLFREVWPTLWGDQAGLSPAFDIAETEDKILVKADLPGIDPKSLDIALTGKTLTVRGEKKVERKEESESYYCAERQFGSFCRSFNLPADVKEDGIEAVYKDGVLEVGIPKAEAAKHKKIEVKTQ